MALVGNRGAAGMGSQYVSDTEGDLGLKYFQLGCDWDFRDIQISGGAAATPAK